MDSTLRPMSTSQVLDRTFSLYRQNFALFAGITVLPPALILIGQILLLTVYNPITRGPFGGSGIGATPDFVKVGLGFMVYLALLVLAFIGYAFASGASVYAVSRVHLGHHTTIAESYRLIMPYFGNILGIVVIVGVCVFGVIIVGVACVVVPFAIGVADGGLRSFSSAAAAGMLVGSLICLATLVVAFYLTAKFSLAVPSCVLERLGVFDSIRRSWSLTQGTVWRLILVIFLAAVFAWLVSAVLSIPYVIGVGLMVSKKDPSVLTPFLVWQYVAEFLARTVAGPVSTIAAALIYYDQRVRKEAFDLQLMMEGIGQPAAAPPVPLPATPPPPFIG